MSSCLVFVVLLLSTINFRANLSTSASLLLFIVLLMSAINHPCSAEHRRFFVFALASSCSGSF